MSERVIHEWRKAVGTFRWRNPFYFLVLVLREICRPFIYWYVFHIFETEVQKAFPGSCETPNCEVRVIGTGKNCQPLVVQLASLGELRPEQIEIRFERGDAVAIAFQGAEPIGYMWLTFSGGMELVFGTAWILKSDEALRYGLFVHPRWRGRGIQTSINRALNEYARDRGIVRTFASISAMNSQSLALPRRLGKPPVMTVFLLRVRGLNWVFRRAAGAPLGSHFSSPRNKSSARVNKTLGNQN